MSGQFGESPNSLPLHHLHLALKSSTALGKKHGPSFVYFVSVTPWFSVSSSQFPLIRGVHIILFLSWHLGKVTEVPRLWETHRKKLFRRRWCSAVMEQKKEIKRRWDSWRPGIAPCPASVIKTIFLTSKLPPLIMSLTFQLESSQLGIPNSGADILRVSGQPWHACLWNGDLCQLYVWLGSCIWHAQQDPSRAAEGRTVHSCLLQAEFGLEQSWFSSKMSQSAGPLWSLKKKKKTKKTHDPLPACIRWTRHVSDSFILSREFVGSWTRTRGFGTWEGFPLSGVAYHQSNPVCRLIRLKL